MLIKFDLEGTSIEFHRNWFTGRALLRVDGRIVPLQDPLSPGTHFSVGLTRTWQCQIGGHDIVIEKKRPVLFAGFRPQTYRVRVGGKVVAERRGY